MSSVDYDTEDLIKRQVKQLRHNRTKSHSQITDSIYKNEAENYETKFRKHLEYKKAYEC